MTKQLRRVAFAGALLVGAAWLLVWATHVLEELDDDGRWEDEP